MRRRVQRLWETVVEAAVRVSGIASIVFIALILFFLVRDAVPLLKTATVGELLAGQKWRPTSEPSLFGFLPLIAGSLLVTTGALLMAIPMGVGCAVFLAEIAPRRLREIVKPMVELLAAIPSVVFGFVGMMVVSAWLQRTSVGLSEALPGPGWLVTALNMPVGLAAVTGSVMLALMTLPTIVSISEDALRAVPRSYREASLALGATRWETIKGVTVPGAKSGIVAAIMLGIGRAVGETMTLLMVTGNSPVIPSLTKGFFRPVRTMTATIAAEMGETARASEHYHALFMLGTLLFLIAFAINTVADIVIHRGKHVEQR
jgi:phosphate transport system permease protein